MLREYLQLEFSVLAAQLASPVEIDLESVVDDVVFISMFVGKDLRTVSIATGG